MYPSEMVRGGVSGIWVLGSAKVRESGTYTDEHRHSIVWRYMSHVGNGGLCSHIRMTARDTQREALGKLCWKISKAEWLLHRDQELLALFRECQGSG